MTVAPRLNRHRSTAIGTPKPKGVSGPQVSAAALGFGLRAGDVVRRLVGVLWLAVWLVPLLAAGSAASPRGVPWRGIHLMAPKAAQVPLFQRAITNALAPLGVNVIVLEVNYNFAWQSHPELRQPNAMGRAEARALAATCRRSGIRLIPLFNCLGHQSWKSGTAPLLTRYPEFDETPQIPKDNPGIYCRSWCPLHPRVNRIVFALMDELLDAFEADALHVGMDEVFLIGSDQCPRCRGQNPAVLFARAVKDYHRHLVGKRKVTMLMWGDRLLDHQVFGYGKWESSDNRTHGALRLIPKDIIICDWHYEPRQEYPSVPFFQKKGFRVWPTSWKNEAAALALLNYARNHDQGKVLGHLSTTWTSGDQVCRALLGEEGEVSATAREAVTALRRCLAELREGR